MIFVATKNGGTKNGGTKKVSLTYFGAVVGSGIRDPE